MHPLALLGVTLGWNWCRHKRDLSTMCSFTRAHVPWWAIVLGWSALTAWLIPHLIRPFLETKRART